MLDSLDTLIAFVLIMLMVSLLITIAVQMVASLLNLRGLNLAQALKRTLTVIVPNTDENAKKLANYVSKGRFLSDSSLPDWRVCKLWRHAAAIRPEEVFDAIQRIAIGKEPAEATVVESAKSLLIALGVDKQILDDAAKKISDGKAANTLTAGYAATTQILSAAKASIDAAGEKFKDWACICQERAQQWFTMHTRVLTILLAIIAAIGLQLDTVDVFKLLSSNKAVRDKLVAQSSAITSQAEKTLGDSTTVLQTAYDAWLSSKTDDKVKAALTSVKIQPTDTRETFTARIAAALEGNSAKADLLKSFDGAVNNAVSDFLKTHAQVYAKIRGDLDKTGFELFPQTEWRWGRRWCDGWTKKHVAGVLFSIALLSLGAPFWYNALKNLANLRSTVAQNISKEQEQAQKQADEGKNKPQQPV